MAPWVGPKAFLAGTVAAALKHVQTDLANKIFMEGGGDNGGMKEGGGVEDQTSCGPSG